MSEEAAAPAAFSDASDDAKVNVVPQGYPLSAESAKSLVRRALAMDAPSYTHEIYDGASLYRIDESFDPKTDACVCAIGAFDGVHTGHASLISALTKDARERGCASVAVTFDPDPITVLAPDTRGVHLLSCEDRVAQLARLGISAVLALPFTEGLRSTSYEDFALLVLRSYLNYRSIHVGADFRMGSGRGGGVEALKKLGAKHGFEVFGENLLGSADEIISATRIRKLLAEGELKQANELLGRCHYVRGHVTHGRGEGTGFGFPTANVEIDPIDCIPQDGVYGCYVAVDERAWPAATNVGAAKSFEGRHEAFLETNLIGFNGDLYGREVEVIFVEYLRSSRRFDSFDELQQTVFSNIEWVCENLGDRKMEVRR